MIIQIRVDDRLIHGQIAVVWSKHFATNHLVKSNSVKMFVLTNSIQDALKIATSCKVESINVANVGRFEAASDKKQLNADVGCTPKKLEALKEIAKLDMETIHWVIPTNPKISVKKLLENI